MKPPICIDFETHPIRQRPDYPPRPVGVAIWDLCESDLNARYLAWDHAGGENNCSLDHALTVLHGIWSSGRDILCHNAKFDMGVATEALDLPQLPWERVHDTMFLAYLYDPHSRRLGLKELAHDLIGLPPEERDAVGEWIWEHRKQLEAEHPQYGTVKPTKLGAWLFAPPAGVVAPYAIGDVVRTGKLFTALLPEITSNGMLAAYNRERQLLPILMENERLGIRADVNRLAVDVSSYSVAYDVAEDWLRKELRADGLNFDADDDVAAILLERGQIDEASMPKTGGGRISMSKEHLTPDKFKDPRVASALGYRNRLSTCLNTFMRPWLAQARVNGGFITTNWNQVRGNEKGGTRSGRPSTSEHNFLNISKDFEGRASDGYVHPDFLACLADFHLPLCRRYLQPDEGGVWLHRDFSGQEVRIFADLEQGELFDAYLANPALDPHDWVKDQISAATGKVLERTRVKNVTFSRLYGGGLGAIERQAKCKDRAEAQEISNAHDKGLPGRVIVVNRIKRLHRMRQPIRTLGGRIYYAEHPGPDGRTKDYKLINYYCQGGAADYTKQTLIEWDDMNRSLREEHRARFLVTVYDEINVSSPAQVARTNMGYLRQVMEAERLGVQVPMLSDGKAGLTWGDQIKEADVKWEDFL